MNWEYEDGRIYSVDENNELMAEATYSLKANGEVDIYHTYVNPILRGKGIAGEMMEVVAEYLRTKSMKATATCPYANVWFRKHQEAFSDIISKDLDNESTACKIDGKH